MRLTASIIFSLFWLAGPAVAADAAPNPDHPGDVALGRDNGTWVYKSFPAFLPLYTFDGDPPGKATCDTICAAVWPIVRAQDYAKPTGDWTIVLRDDGRRQWAYKGKPVHTFYLDRPGEPKGVGRMAEWYLEEDADGHPLPGVKPRPKNAAAKPGWRLIVP